MSAEDELRQSFGGGFRLGLVALLHAHERRRGRHRRRRRRRLAERQRDGGLHLRVLRRLCGGGWGRRRLEGERHRLLQLVLLALSLRRLRQGERDRLAQLPLLLAICHRRAAGAAAAAAAAAGGDFQRTTKTRRVSSREGGGTTGVHTDGPVK